MSSCSKSGTLLCVFLLLGICIGIVTATTTEPKTENIEESFGTSSIRLWPRWWWHRRRAPSIGWWWSPHPKKPSPPTHVDVAPSPSPVDSVASPTHAAPSPSPIDYEASASHTAPAPTTACIKVDDCKSDLITSIFKRKISLSTQCCKVLSTISGECFYQEFSHSKRVPFFLGKVRNYCSHAVDNAASPTHASQSQSPVDNVASPTHAAPSLSPVDNAAPSPSPVDDVISPPHMAPSMVPAPTPTNSCIKVDGCALNLITSVFKRKISLSTQCCQVLSIISDDCFYKEFTHFKRVPFFLGKVRNYCSHHQG